MVIYSSESSFSKTKHNFEIVAKSRQNFAPETFRFFHLSNISVIVLLVNIEGERYYKDDVELLFQTGLNCNRALLTHLRVVT